jgi:hypothetical protein
MTRAILFLSVILPTICNAQPPLPFPTGDAHWTVNSVDMGNSFPDRIYATMGDTLINGILYEKLGWVENTGLPFDPVDLTYYGSIHDEDGRWLYIPSGDNSEYTLYDFTGVVGDTITVENPRWQNGPQEYRVQSIIETSVVSGIRRLWVLFHTTNSWSEYWVEGVGAIDGLFGHSSFIFDVGEQLVCLQQDAELVYRLPEAESCYYLHTGLVEQPSTSKVSIFPNPASTHLTMQMDDTWGNATISLYNGLAQQIKPKWSSRSDNTLTMDISLLPSGFYTVSVSRPDSSTLHLRASVVH